MSDQPTDPYAPQPGYPPIPPVTPAYIPAQTPADATTAQQPAYHPYPTTGTAPHAPAPRRTSALTWVFAILAVLLLAGGGGLGYVYNQARKTVADQKTQITTLQGTVDSQATDLKDAQADLKDAQADLKDANDQVTTLEACKAAVQKFVDSLNGTDAESEAAALAMFNACDSNL